MPALKLPGANTETAPQGPGKDKFLLIATVGWFMVTFVRIQDMLPFFKALMPGAISTVALMIAIGMRLKEIPWSDTIVRALLVMLAGITTGIAYALNTYWLFTDFVTLFTYGLVFMMAMPILAKNPYCLRVLFSVIALSALVTAIWGITHSGHGQGAWLGDENDVALWLTTGTPLCYFAARSAYTRRGRIVLLATAAFCAIATVASFSRGGFVGLTVGVFGIGLFRCAFSGFGLGRFGLRQLETIKFSGVRILRKRRCAQRIDPRGQRLARLVFRGEFVERGRAGIIPRGALQCDGFIRRDGFAVAIEIFTDDHIVA